MSFSYQMGIDRLALMEGGLATTTTLDQPIICVSAGTAITIDLVSEERHHLGGVILPGIAMPTNRFVAVPIVFKDGAKIIANYTLILAIKRKKNSLN